LAGIVDHALRIQIVGVVVIGFFSAPLCVLKYGLQALAHGRRNMRHASEIRFTWLLSRHNLFALVLLLILPIAYRHTI
jgi:hypothetical protein